MSLDADAELLSAIPVFKLLEPEAIRLLAFHAEEIELAEGDMLFNNGDKSDGGLVVLDGTIELVSESEGVRSTVTVKKGSLIGQLALITDVTHRSDAKAMSRASIMKIQRNSFQRVLREYPGTAAKIRASIASDLLEFTSALARSRA